VKANVIENTRIGDVQRAGDQAGQQNCQESLT
jgi:hypothetical protein